MKNGGEDSELVQLKLNIETSVAKASGGGFRSSRLSTKIHSTAKGESTPTEAEYGVPLPLVEAGVSLKRILAYIAVLIFIPRDFIPRDFITKG